MFDWRLDGRNGGRKVVGDMRIGGLRGNLRHMTAAFGYSVAGIAATFRHETAFRQEVALVVPHVILLFLLQGSALCWIVLTALLGVVLSLELLNTAIECVVDLVSPEFHELAKRAKDAASAAVGVTLAVYALAWVVLAVNRFC